MTENSSQETNEKAPVGNQQEEKRSNKIPLIIAFLSIVIIIQGIKIYLDYQEGMDKDATIESTSAELQNTLLQLEDISEELDEKIAEIEKLGGDITELEVAKAEIEKERDQLRNTRSANRKVISDLKGRVEGYQELLRAKDEEIVKLREVNEVLLSENTGLKVQKNQLSDSISNLSESAEKLADKVAIASTLEAENIGIVAVNAKGRERESPFRNKHIDKLKVTFNIAENKVAPIEGKDIMIQIIDSNGQVLFDVTNGSGTFMIDGKEAFYTASQEILFDNSNQLVTFIYDKGSEYELGQYTMVIYTEGYKMGTYPFIVK